jgi:hypothetical protein
MTALPLDEALDEAASGGKTTQLALARRAGLPVPAGAALSVSLVEAIARGEPAALSTLDRALQPLRPPLAARSSAVGEDSTQASFAGQMPAGPAGSRCAIIENAHTGRHRDCPTPGPRVWHLHSAPAPLGAYHRAGSYSP